MNDFRSILRSGRILLLDGGMGTMLQSRGLPPGASPERFCLDRPDILQGVHREYIRSGSDIILTATFGGTRFKLPNDLDPRSFSCRMAEIAREAASEAGRKVWVAGDMGPTGHFARPLGDVDAADLYEAYREQARGLLQGGVDLFLIETQFDLAEMRLAVAAVRAESDLPVLVSMTFEDGVSLTGTTPEIMAETMANMGVDGIGTNCGVGPEGMKPVIRRLLSVCREAGIAVLAEPNAGLPELDGDKTVFRLSPEAFAEQTAEFADEGVSLLGGCCGTTPAHIAALSAAIHGREGRPLSVSEGNSIVLTSRSEMVRIGGSSPIAIIGERLNPTGKKALQAELQSGIFSLAMQMAADQIALGASLLDVNVGDPLVDETRMLPEIVLRLTERHAVPLSLDSSSAAAMELSLPLVPGSPLVNSISGEGDRMERMAPLCRQWGAPFILLPLKGKKLPVSSADRIAIIEELLNRAESLGIPRRLILVDVLALSVASMPQAAEEGLKTIQWCRKNGLPTVMGLSNISFGLPARDLINTSFLAMSAGAGLSACIANPSSVRLREIVAASNVLCCRDDRAERFVASYANWKPSGGGSESKASSGQSVSHTAETLGDAVLVGDRDGMPALLDRELKSGRDPFQIVQETLIPAINEVGCRYERREYFLPQLLRSAETMKDAFETLRPILAKRSGGEARPVAILATVEGDIHDIGKNIVGLMLGNHGFDVVDLGKDVKAEVIAAEAETRKASLVCLSALMTTTMTRMPETLMELRKRHLDIPVMIGGAVVTGAYAEKIGAFYSSNAVEAVRVAQMLVRNAEA
ncbi:MAG: homocysteine S-methyltransferase family protein [Desulfovibrionaceae bacterium]|nr:homocysteine S-methyltransferase family protein [Desulfovibrionaceae bacterium]